MTFPLLLAVHSRRWQRQSDRCAVSGARSKRRVARDEWCTGASCRHRAENGAGGSIAGDDHTRTAGLAQTVEGQTCVRGRDQRDDENRFEPGINN